VRDGGLRSSRRIRQRREGGRERRGKRAAPWAVLGQIQ